MQPSEICYIFCITKGNILPPMFLPRNPKIRSKYTFPQSAFDKTSEEELWHGRRNNYYN